MPFKLLSKNVFQILLISTIASLLIIISLISFSKLPNRIELLSGDTFKLSNNYGVSNSYISNPAAVYCTDLGYQFTISDDESGQRGLCILPDNSVCDAWDFLQGTCGQSYSYCARQGYKIKQKSDGKDPFSHRYSVCTTLGGSEVGSVVNLSGLQEKVNGSNCGNDEISSFSPKSSLPIIDNIFSSLTILAEPTSFDWRNYLGQNWLTPVKDQANCGSCWAFASIGAVEAAYNIGYNNPDLDLDLSEQYLVSGCSDTGNCCGGYSYYTLQYIRDQGVPDDSCMTYADSFCSCSDVCSTSCTYHTGGNCSNRTCSDRCADWSSRLIRVDEVGSVSPSIAAIKQSLVENGPVVVSMGIGTPFGGYWDGDIYRCADDSATNHAVVLVGYDDSGGYWIVRNSWGASWNGNGYFKVGYGECMIEYYPRYVIENPPGTTPTPTATVTQTATPGAAYCSPDRTLSCGGSNSWSNNGVGSTNQISSYSCTSWNESGPEYTYQFTPTESGQVTVSLSNLSADLDIFILDNATGSCSAGNCIAYGDSSASFDVVAGQIYYLVVDGYVGAVGSYTIGVECEGAVTPTATETSTLTATPTQTLTPMSGPQVRVIDAWTSDENYQPKTIFYPGDPIRWFLDVENLTGADAEITLTYDIRDPYGAPAAYWSGPVTTSSGVIHWYMSGTIPYGNGGTYTFNGSGLYQGLLSNANTSYYVNDPTGTPTASATRTFTPTITRTATRTSTPTTTRTSTSTPTRTRTTTPTRTSTRTPTSTITPTATQMQEDEYLIYLPAVIK